MKHLLIALLLASPLAAQQAPPPDLIASQTAAAAALGTYQQWIETQNAKIWLAITQQQSLTSNLPQDEAAITSLLSRVAALEAQVKLLTPATPPATPTPTPSAVTINANTASSGIATGDVLTTPDSASNGNKVTLVAGRSYVYSPAITAGTYTVTLRLSSDSTATGSMTLHVESPQGTSIGAVTVACGGGWANVTVVSHAPFTGPPVVVVADAVCKNSYLDLISLQP